MKKLIIVSGTMGVGKSATCKQLYKLAPRTAWLDGNWCWLMHPWNACEENKAMVMSNIVTMLDAYLKNSTIDNILFSWVIHKADILEGIVKPLSNLDFELCRVALVCSPEELRTRMEKDARDEEQINASIEKLPLYYLAGWPLLDTSLMDEYGAACSIAATCGLVRILE